MGMPLAATRELSIGAIESAVATEEKELLVFSQRDAEVESPSSEDLFHVGTKAVVRRLTRIPTGGVQLLVQAMERVRLRELFQDKPYLSASYEAAPMVRDESVEEEALGREVTSLASRVMTLARPGVDLDLTQLPGDGGVDRLVYLLASMLALDLTKAQRLLELDRLQDALQQLHEYLEREVRVLEVRKDIASKAEGELAKQQRAILLRQQLRAIQEELGETEDDAGDLQELERLISGAELPDDVREEAERALKRLERIPSALAEYGVIRNYLEVLVELPWARKTDAVVDLERARLVLDEDHLHLDDLKDRILEHLAILKLNPAAKAPILSFVGPPGVGKTSLGKSIARALNRKFERMSLGGLHDEAELRGHRRTYVGAMPGRIIQAIRRADVNNPVLMLDEIDKLGRDFRGDPASAMLEILDPEQNDSFRDNYLNLPFDLSDVFFITTANTTDTIPRPLLDRMEVLTLTGYSEEEKIAIAKRYLMPRTLKESGLDEQRCSIDDQALARCVRFYTREAGVRQLERVIGRIVRKVAYRVAMGDHDPVVIGEKDLVELLGPEAVRPELARESLPPGVAAGLAWTQTGGDVLYVESSLRPGGTGLTLTGQLGDVMQESARAAQSYLWAHADGLGIDGDQFRSQGVHIHVPAGAIPKDGPSAGITIATALASLYRGESARHDTAMTGEITLTGLVLPVGGIKEKVLAAKRAGFTRVIVPKHNESDLRDLPEDVAKQVEFVFVERVDQVLSECLPMATRELSPS